MTDIHVTAPDGTPGTIPEEHLGPAIEAGFSRAATPRTELEPGKVTADGATEGVTRSEVPVIAPDGSPGTIPAEKLDEARAAGFLTVEEVERGEKEQATDAAAAQAEEQARQAKFAGVGGALEAGAMSAANELTGGLYGKAVQALSPNPQAQAAEEQSMMGANPGAALGGKAVGFVEQALGLGAAGKAIAGATGLTGLSAAAAEGAVYASPDATRQALEGNPGQAAESLALGVGLNLGLHAAFTMAGKAAEGLRAAPAEVTEASEAGADAKARAENVFLKELGASPAARDELRGKVPDLIKAADITADDTAETAVKKIQGLESSGKDIGAAIDKLDALPGRSGIIRTALGDAQEKIVGLLDNLVGAEKDQAAKTLRPFVDQIAAEGNRAAEAGEESLSFRDTQRLKRWTGEQTNFTDSKFVNGLRQKADGIIRESIRGAEDQAAHAIGDPTIVDALTKGRLAYSLSQTFGDLAARQAAKELPQGTMQRLMQNAGHISRYTPAMMLAHMVVGPLGGPAVAAAHAGLGMLKHYAEKSTFGSAVKLLRAGGEASVAAPSTAMVADAVEQTQSKIRDAVRGLADHFAGARAPAKAAATRVSLGALLPNGGTGLTRAQQLTAVQRAIATNLTAPEQHGEHLTNLTQGLRAEGLDNTATAFTQQQLRVMKVLQDVLPKDPSMALAHPFAGNVKPQEISPTVRADYERALATMQDPTSVLERVKSNTITQKDVMIAMATHPALFGQMRDQLMDEMAKSRPDLSYQQRLSLDILMGTNFAQSTQYLSMTQAAYAGGGGPQAPSPRPRKQPSKLSAASAKNLTEGVMLPADKAASLG